MSEELRAEIAKVLDVIELGARFAVCVDEYECMAHLSDELSGLIYELLLDYQPQEEQE